MLKYSCRDAIGIRPAEPCPTPIKLAPWAATAAHKAVPVTNLKDIQFAAEQVARQQQLHQQQAKPVERAPAPRAVPQPVPVTVVVPEAPKQPTKSAKVCTARLCL
jgi:hypothetical protein